MWPLYYFFFIIVFLNCSCHSSDLEYDGKVNIKLEHFFENKPTPVFFSRGEIFIKSLHSGAYSVEENQLTNDKIQTLKNLAKENGYYRLKATVKNNEKEGTQLYTFVKACSLIESHLTNYLAVNLDHNGNVIAVTMSVPKNCLGRDISSNFLEKFNTTVEVRHMELAPVPDTATYIQKVEKEREAKERGDLKDNRSFFAKYWMYILPVVIFLLLPSVTNPEAGGGGSAQR